MNKIFYRATLGEGQDPNEFRLCLEAALQKLDKNLCLPHFEGAIMYMRNTMLSSSLCVFVMGTSCEDIGMFLGQRLEADKMLILCVPKGYQLCSSVSDMVEYRHGLIVPYDHPEDIAQPIVDFLNQPDARGGLAEIM